MLQRTKETLVFVVRTDPKPMDCVGFQEAQYPISIRDTHRIDRATAAHTSEA